MPGLPIEWFRPDRIPEVQTIDTFNVIGNGVPLGDDRRQKPLPMGIDGFDPPGQIGDSEPRAKAHFLASDDEMRTERLEIRPVVETDRRRFVELFMDPDFMVFSATGVLAAGPANHRFDHMIAFSRKVPFGKQAIVELSTASVVGYVGVDEFEFLGERRFEFGYRLDKVVRGIGYATEASRALLALVEQEWKGELLAFIDPENSASQNVLSKTGFSLVDRIMIRGGACDLYCHRIGPRSDGCGGLTDMNQHGSCN